MEPLATVTVPPLIVPPVRTTELVRLVVVRSRVPAVTVTVPEPSAASTLATTVPAETVVPPV